MPTVSIVLPSYNGSKYIREAIDSIREQTYTDWELIIVDDCSKDDTLEIAREYEKTDKRIRVVHNEENQKLPNSLNIGFVQARGEYLTWTSDDNLYLQDALSVMIERLEKSDVAMVCADMCSIDANGDLMPGAISGYKDEELYLYNSIGACFLYRREIIENVGPYDEHLFCVEDYDYWLRIKEKYGRIERIDRVLYKYRRHNNSLSFLRQEKIRMALIQLRKKHLNFILDEIKNKEEFLYRFYYEMLEKKTIDEELRDRIQSFVPALRNDVVGIKEKYIIFGAGQYGEKAYEELKESVVFFADNNQSKVGQYKNGKETNC